MKQSAAKPQQTNVCIHCNKSKKLEDFVKDKRTKLGVRNTCLECTLKKSYTLPNYRKRRSDRVRKYRNTFRGGIYQRMSAARERARKEGYPFDLDVDYLIEIFHFQKGKCALSGREMKIGNEYNWWDRASLDKINPELGYVKGNIQFLTNRVNFSKGNLTNEEFFSLCKEIVEEGSETISLESTSQATGDGSAKQQES